MDRKLIWPLVLLSLFVALSATSTPVCGADYERVGLNLGDTADYLVSRSDIPPAVLNRMRLIVVNVTGIVVEFNATFYFTNGTKDQSWLQQGNVSSGELSQYIVAPDLSVGDPIAQIPDAPTINETVLIIVMGGLRQVNHLRYVAEGVAIESYWDKASGLVVQRSAKSYGYSMNYTLVSTSVWSPVAKPLIYALLIVGGISSFVIVVACLVLYIRKK
jgi:hypothetical protein